MFDQILVPVDGSMLAENILPHTVAIAKAYNSDVTLISVLDPLDGRASASIINPSDWQIQRAEMQAYLNDLSSQFQASGLKVSMIGLEGKAPERVLDYATSMGTNLIMLSSHGQGGISAWNNSSVVTKIIQQARTSVMINRSYSSSENSPAYQGYRRILVPLDGSRRAEYGLLAAVHLARAEAAELLVAHVVKPPELPRRTPLSDQDRTIIRQVVESNQAEASQYLDSLKANLDCNVETRLLTGDSVAEALHTLVEQESVDLVILNAHGLGGNSRRHFGSLTINFLAYSTTALLIVQDFTRDLLLETKAETFAQDYLGQPPKILEEARQNYRDVRS
jgi:nucleotide-binding universal stress UspA family protein